VPGIRLRHPTLRNQVYTVGVPHRRYLSPYQCPRCQVEHHVKTYHFVLDADGAVIVSTEILRRLQEVPGIAGLLVENEVKEPPKQKVIVGGM
jgi:hypothetical protein